MRLPLTVRQRFTKSPPPLIVPRTLPCSEDAEVLDPVCLVCAAAPDFVVPGLPDHFDCVFLLDVIHFLSESALELTLRRIYARLSDGGLLIIRASIPPSGHGSVMWNLYRLHRFLTGTSAYFRTVEQTSEHIRRAGFDLQESKMSGANPELFWFVGSVSSLGESRRIEMNPMPVSAENQSQNDN